MTLLPRIVMFYGFKGGAGRSFLLASMAAALAADGKRVLVIDADLEAPGIGDFFDGLAHGSDWRGKIGLLDLLEKVPRNPDAEELRETFCNKLLAREADGKPWDPRPDVFSHICPYGDEAEPRTGIWLLGPGSHAADRLAGPQRYIRQVTDFDWGEFMRSRKGSATLGLLMEELIEKGQFHHVLIDARTGYNFASLMLLRSVATDVVAVSTSSIQSLDGMARVLPILDFGTRGPPPRKHLVISKDTPAGQEDNQRDILLGGWFEEKIRQHCLPFVGRLINAEDHLFLCFQGLHERFVGVLRDEKDPGTQDAGPEVGFLHNFQKLYEEVTGLTLNKDDLLRSFEAWGGMRRDFGKAKGVAVDVYKLEDALKAWIEKEANADQAAGDAQAKKDPQAKKDSPATPEREVMARGPLEREYLRWCAAEKIEEELKGATDKKREPLAAIARRLSLDSLPVLPPRLKQLLTAGAAPETSDDDVPASVYRLVAKAMKAGLDPLSETDKKEWEKFEEEVAPIPGHGRAGAFAAVARSLRTTADLIVEEAGSQKSLGAAENLAEAVERLGAPVSTNELMKWNGCDFLAPLREAVLVNAISAPAVLSRRTIKLTNRLAEIARKFESGLREPSVRPLDSGSSPAAVGQWLGYADTIVAIRRGLFLLANPDALPADDPFQKDVQDFCGIWIEDFGTRVSSEPEAWNGLVSAETLKIRLERDAIVRTGETVGAADRLEELRSRLGNIAEKLFEARGRSTDDLWIAPLYCLLSACDALDDIPLKSRAARHLLAVLRPYGAYTDVGSACKWMRIATFELGLGFSVEGRIPVEQNGRDDWPACTELFFAGRFRGACQAIEKNHHSRSVSTLWMLNWHAAVLALLGDLDAADAQIAKYICHYPLVATVGRAGLSTFYAVSEALRCAAARGHAEFLRRLGRRLDSGIEAAPGNARENRFVLLARLARRLGEVRIGALSAADTFEEAAKIAEDYDALMARRAFSHADADYAWKVGYPWASLGMFTGRDVPAYKRRDHALVHISVAEIAFRAKDNVRVASSLDQAARLIGADAPQDALPSIDDRFLDSIVLALHEPRALWAALRAALSEGERRAAFRDLAQKERQADLEAEGGRADRRIFFDPVWQITGLGTAPPN